MKKEYVNLDTYNETEQVCPACNGKGEMVYLAGCDLWTCQLCGENSDDDHKTLDDFEAKRKEVMAIDIAGFDPEWVMAEFGRITSLRTIRYARSAATEEEYAMLVQFFRTGSGGRYSNQYVIKTYTRIIDTYYGSNDGDVGGVQPEEAIEILDSIVNDYLSYLVPSKDSKQLN